MHSDRKKLGLVVPSLNSVMEYEIQRMSARGTSVHTMRVSAHWTGVAEKVGTRENLLWMDSQATAAAKLLAHAKVDVICYGCTGGGVVEGPGAERAICDEITAATGIPAVATISAVARALRSFNAMKIGIASPYEPWLNECLRQFFDNSGFEVLAIEGFGRKINFEEAARVTAQDVADLAANVDRPECEAIFISCTNFPTLEVIEPLEQKLGKPVITSTSASMWEMLRVIDDRRSVPQGGELFRHV